MSKEVATTKQQKTPMNVFDTLMKDFWSPWTSPSYSDFRVDVKDRKKYYEVDAELPGLNREDIDVTVEDGYLTISATQDENVETEDECGYIINERRMGEISRSFAIHDVDESKVTAKYQDGILKVKLPKSKENIIKEHKVTIE